MTSAPPDARTAPPAVPAIARPEAGSGRRFLTPATIAFAGVGLLAAVLYAWNLAINGYANTYYAGAVLAASQSWKAWFFGALDAGSFITVDKPALSTMLMGLSVRVFGMSSWAMLLPQALLGVGSVLLLFVTVRRQFGLAAATIAGVALAITPVAALIFRFNNPDAITTFMLVLGAYGLQRAIESGAHRWLVLAGVATGLAFLAKYFQGWLAGPAFVLAYAVAANASLRRRVVGVVVFGAATVLTAAAWVLPVALIPAADRPYIGGSTSNSVLDLIFGYDGLGRLFGASSGGAGGANFSGGAGILRLFNAEMGGQIAWLIPFAAIALAVGLAVTARAPRTDLRRAAYLLWGGWAVVSGLVLSLMSGGSHPYYAVVVAPAIAALVGGGFVEMWALRRRHRWGGLPLAAAVLSTALLSFLLLSRSPDFVPWLAPAVLGLGFLSAPFLAVPELPDRRLEYVLGGVGLAAVLAGPLAFSLQTATTVQTGTIVSAGPTASATDVLSISGSGGFGSRGGFGGGAPFGGGGPRGGFGGGSANSELVAFLQQHMGSATWAVAVGSAQSGAELSLATGLPVMSTGGFTGSDNALSVDQLKAFVASGQLRYFIAGGQGDGPGGGSSEVASWVAANATPMTVGGATLYDLAGTTGS